MPIPPLALGLWGALKRVPWQAWAVLALAFIVWRAIGAYGDAIQDAHDDGYSAGVEWVTAEAKAEALQVELDHERAIAELKQEQEAATENIVNDYEAEIAGIDARADDWRVRYAAQRTRAENLAQSFEPTTEGDAAAGAGEAPAGDGLPWAVAAPLLIQAAKDRAQLDAILDWNDEQQRIYDQWVADQTASEAAAE